MTAKEKMIKMIQNRTDAELIRDWEVLDLKEVTTEVAIVRGIMMDEIEKRFPTEFDAWMESCEEDDNITNYIKI